MAGLTSLLLPLAVGVTATLAFLAGISTCLSVWIIPLLSHAPPRARIRQFKHMTDLGFYYLQTSSRILAFLLFILTVATYRGGTGVFGKDMWKFSVTALLILLPTAPYEIIAIFPINDRIDAIGADIDAAGASGGEKMEVKYNEEITRLLRNWQWANVGRFVSPSVASVILLWGLASAS